MDAGCEECGWMRLFMYLLDMYAIMFFAIFYIPLLLISFILEVLTYPVLMICVGHVYADVDPTTLA